MKYTIGALPSSYLEIEFEKGEQIITEKGAFIYSNGEFTVENKIEIKSYKSLVAKLVGKNFSYNVYSAKEPLKMLFAPKDAAEIFRVEVDEKTPVLFEPDLHFARIGKLEFELYKKTWKTTFTDGMKLKTIGTGTLFLKGYGRILELEINDAAPVCVDEEALIAFEQNLDIKIISKGAKAILTSGEGFLFAISGKGKLWIQTREKSEVSGGGGIISTIIDSVT